MVLNMLRSFVMSKKEDHTDNHSADDVKSNFLATMSHEMRTPMQSVYGLLELIELEDTSDHVKDMVRIAKGSASSLLEILDDVLELSKMDAGKMELDEFEIPVRTLVRGVNEALSVRVKERPVELGDDVSDEVPVVIKGDPKRLRQVLMNLVGNALKFTEKGTVKTLVKTKSKTPLILRFEVHDTGIGITQDACDALFSPFSQADSSTSRKFGGTGLGLSICRKLVELMGGDIGVESVLGEGTIFWFEIPTVEIDARQSDLELPNLDGLYVLSVEDHPQGAKEIVSALSSMGAQVESCSNIEDARKLSAERPFDVAIIDQGLPDGDGLTLLRRLLDLYPFMGCVMYTAREDVGLRNSLGTLGVSYVTKPASRKGLGEAVLDAAQKSNCKNKRQDMKEGTRLIIADDTASIRDLFSRQLKSLGVECDMVANGHELLSAMKNRSYDLVITDLHMPECDGYGVIEQIRMTEQGRNNDDQVKDHQSVVLLTADIQMANRQTYKQLGFDECLLKPVTLGQLKRLLIRWGILDDARPSVSSPKGFVDQGESDAIDLKALERQLGAIDEMAIEMLSSFIEMTKPLINKLVIALKNDDIHSIKQTAHSLKGSARSAGAVVLGDIAYEVQETAEKGNAIHKDIIEDIIAEFDRVKEHVKTIEALNK